ILRARTCRQNHETVDYRLAVVSVTDRHRERVAATARHVTERAVARVLLRHDTCAPRHYGSLDALKTEARADIFAKLCQPLSAPALGVGFYLRVNLRPKERRVQAHAGGLPYQDPLVWLAVVSFVGLEQCTKPRIWR